MADRSVLNLDFRKQVQQVRQTFKEVERLQEGQQKRSRQQVRVESRHWDDRLEHLKERVKQNRILDDTQAKSFAKRVREGTKKYQQEKQAAEDQGRTHDRNRRREKQHVRDLNNELRRGPLRRAAGKVGRTAAFAGGGLLGLAIGASLRGYQNYMSFQQTLGPSIGLGGRGGREASIAGRGGNLGFNINERAQLVPQMARATGVVSPRALMTGQRATGISAGELAGIFGTMRRGGTRFGGRRDVINPETGEIETENIEGQGEQRFARLIERGMVSGLERARLPEFFKGVTQLMEQQQAAMTGRVGSGIFSRFASVLGRFGKRNDLPGLQGQRGAGLMSKIHQGIIAPGAGEAGDALIRQAMGFGTPGGSTGFYQAEKMRERGLGDPRNFDRVMQEMTRQYGTGEDAAIVMRDVFGVSLDQAEQLIKLSQSNESMNAKMEKVDSVLAEQKSVEERSLEQFKKAGTELGRIAGMFDESVSIGYDVKDLIHAIEDMQRAITKEVLTWIPKIGSFLSGALDHLSELVPSFKRGVNYIVKAINAIPGVEDIELPFAEEEAARKKEAKQSDRRQSATTAVGVAVSRGSSLQERSRGAQKLAAMARTPQGRKAIRSEIQRFRKIISSGESTPEDLEYQRRAVRQMEQALAAGEAGGPTHGPKAPQDLRPRPFEKPQWLQEVEARQNYDRRMQVDVNINSDPGDNVTTDVPTGRTRQGRPDSAGRR